MKKIIISSALSVSLLFGFSFSKNEEKKTFHNNGAIKTVGEYNSDGQKDGAFKQYDMKGNILIDGMYEDGKPLSEKLYMYHPNYLKKEKICLNNSDEPLSKRSRPYYEDGLKDGEIVNIKELPDVAKYYEYKNGALVNGYEFVIDEQGIRSKQKALLTKYVNAINYIQEIVNGKSSKCFPSGFNCKLESSKKFLLENNSYSLKYLKTNDENIHLKAMAENAHLIKHIDNPSAKVQLAAYDKLKKKTWQELLILEYVKNPSKQIIDLLVKDHFHHISEKYPHLIGSNEELQLIAVKESWPVIEKIENPSEKVQLAAVKQVGHAIEYIKNPTEKVKMAAVKNDGTAIKYIKNPSEAIQLAAVKQSPYALKYIKNPSEKIQLVAIKKAGSEIKHINKPSEAVQIAAVKQNFKNIKYIKNPSKAVIAATGKTKNELVGLIGGHDESEIIEAVKKDPRKLKNIKNPSLEVQLAAVTKSGGSIAFIKNPSLEVQLAAVQQDAMAIRGIKINEIDEKIQLEAVQKNGMVIQYINNPTKKVELAAFEQNPKSIGFIKNPTDDMIINAYHKIQRSIGIQPNILFKANNKAKATAAIYHPRMFRGRKNQQTGDVKKIIKILSDKNYFRKLKYQTTEMQLAYLRAYGYDDSTLAKHIKKPTSEFFKLSAMYLPDQLLRNFKDIDEKYQKTIINKYPNLIKEIKNPSKALQLIAVKNRGHLIQYIKNPSEAVQLAAVNQHGQSIKYIKNPSEKVKIAAAKNGGIIDTNKSSDDKHLLAVKKNGNNIRQIKNPSKIVQLAAVKQNGKSIQYIKNPSEEVQLAAINQNPEAIVYLENPSEKVQLEAIKTKPTNIALVDNPSKKIVEMVRKKAGKKNITVNDLRKDWTQICLIENPTVDHQSVFVDMVQDKWTSVKAFQFFNNPNENIQRLSANGNYRVLKYLKNPSESVQKSAIASNYRAIQYIKNPSEKIQLYATNRNNGMAIEYIDNPSEKVQLVAVQGNGANIEYIKNPSEAVQLAAVKQWGPAVQYIDNPNEKIQKIAFAGAKEFVKGYFFKENYRNVTPKDYLAKLIKNPIPEIKEAISKFN